MADLSVIENLPPSSEIGASNIDKDAKTVNAPKGGVGTDLSDAWSILPSDTLDPTMTARDHVVKMAENLKLAEENAKKQEANAKKCVEDAEKASAALASAKEGHDAARREEQRKALEASVAAATDAVNEAANASRALDTALTSTTPTLIKDMGNMCVGLYGSVYAACPAPDNTCPAQLSDKCIRFPDVPCPASARTAR